MLRAMQHARRGPRLASGRARGVAAVLLIAAVPFALGARELADGRPIASFGDNASTYYPLRLEAARQWAEGRVPLWNPYKRAGAPLLGDAIAAALYPTTFAFALAELSRERAMGAVALLHHALAGCFAYWFLRVLALRRAAAALGALVYALNGFAVFTAGLWLGIQSAMVWTPLVLGCLERALRSAAPMRWASLGALAYALQILAGFPEIAAYGGLLAAGYAAARTARRPRAWARAAGVLTLIGVGGALLAAPQVLTTLEAARESTRPATLPVETFARGSLRPVALLGAVVPGVPLPTDVFAPMAAGSAYLGIAALCFAGAALRRVDALVAYALLVSAAAAVLALGSFSPVGPVGHLVPGLNAFRSPWKHLFELSLGLSLLSALGADRFLRRADGTRLAVCALAPVLCALAALRQHAVDPSGALLLSHALPTLGAPLALAALAAFGLRRSAVAVALAGAVLALAQNRASLLESQRRAGSPPVAAAPELDIGLGARFARVLVLRHPLQSTGRLLGDTPTQLRIPALHGDGPFLWKPLADAVGLNEPGLLDPPRVLAARDQTLSVLAVRYVLSPRFANGDVLFERALRATPGAVFTESPEDLLVERPGKAALAFVARSVACVEDPARFLHEPTYDLRRTALVSCDAPGAAAPSAGRGRVEAARLEPGRVALRAVVSSDAPSLLVVRQPDYPGWRARVDGAPAPIVRVDGLIQGVWLPPGGHDVDLRYAPASASAGFALAPATLVALCAAAVVEARRRGAADA